MLLRCWLKNKVQEASHRQHAARVVEEVSLYHSKMCYRFKLCGFIFCRFPQVYTKFKAALGTRRNRLSLEYIGLRIVKQRLVREPMPRHLPMARDGATLKPNF